MRADSVSLYTEDQILVLFLAFSSLCDTDFHSELVYTLVNIARVLLLHRHPSHQLPCFCFPNARHLTEVK